MKVWRCFALKTSYFVMPFSKTTHFVMVFNLFHVLLLKSFENPFESPFESLFESPFEDVLRVF